MPVPIPKQGERRLPPGEGQGRATRGPPSPQEGGGRDPNIPNWPGGPADAQSVDPATRGEKRYREAERLQPGATGSQGEVPDTLHRESVLSLEGDPPQALLAAEKSLGYLILRGCYAICCSTQTSIDYLSKWKSNFEPVICKARLE